MNSNVSRNQSTSVPQIGDVVLIKDLTCGRWKMGRIHELVKGRDQLIRSAKILVSLKGFLRRPLSLLYPIECLEDKKVIQDDNEKAEKPNCNQEEVSSSNDDRIYGEAESDIDLTAIPRGDLVPRKGRLVQATLSAKRKLKEWLNPPEHFISLRSVAIDIAIE